MEEKIYRIKESKLIELWESYAHVERYGEIEASSMEFDEFIDEFTLKE